MTKEKERKVYRVHEEENGEERGEKGEEKEEKRGGKGRRAVAKSWGGGVKRKGEGLGVR